MMNATVFLGMKYQKLTITLSQACDELGIAAGTGSNLVSRREFPVPTRRQGNQRVVDIRDLAEYLDAERKDAREAFGCY